MRPPFLTLFSIIPISFGLSPVIVPVSTISTPYPLVPISTISTPYPLVPVSTISTPYPLVPISTISTPLPLIVVSPQGGCVLAILFLISQIALQSITAAAIAILEIAVDIAEAALDVLADYFTTAAEQFAQIGEQFSTIADSFIEASEEGVESSEGSMSSTTSESTESIEASEAGQSEAEVKGLKKVLGELCKLGEEAMDVAQKAFSKTLSFSSQSIIASHQCNGGDQLHTMVQATADLLASGPVGDLLSGSVGGSASQAASVAIGVGQGLAISTSIKAAQNALEKSGLGDMGSCVSLAVNGGMNAKSDVDAMKGFIKQLKQDAPEHHDAASQIAGHHVCEAGTVLLKAGKRLVVSEDHLKCHSHKEGNKIQSKSVGSGHCNRRRQLSAAVNTSIYNLYRFPPHGPENNMDHMHPSHFNKSTPCGCTQKVVTTAQEHQECTTKTTDVAHLDVSNMFIWKDVKGKGCTNETLIWHTCIVDYDHADEIEKYYGKINRCIMRPDTLHPYGFPNISVTAHYHAETPEHHKLTLDFFHHNYNNPGILGFTQEPPPGCNVKRIKNVVYLGDGDVAPHWSSNSEGDVCHLLNEKVEKQKAKQTYRDKQCCESEDCDLKVKDFVSNFV